MRQALQDTQLASAFVRQAPAEMAVMEQIEDHPDRCVLTAKVSMQVGWAYSRDHSIVRRL